MDVNSNHNEFNVETAVTKGFTPQYLEMNALLQQYGNSHFDFLGFPCNQFAYQEPGANKSEIMNSLRYVRPGKGYVPAFEMMAKSDVNGDNENPLYKYLKRYCRSPRDSVYLKHRLTWDVIKPDDITWNFEKFVINPNGIPVARFLSVNTPGYIVSELMKEISMPETNGQTYIED